MEQLFRENSLEEPYYKLVENDIVDLQTLQDFINKKPQKFEEWFPTLGLQLQIERLCEKGLQSALSKSSSIGDSAVPMNFVSQISENHGIIDATLIVTDNTAVIPSLDNSAEVQVEIIPVLKKPKLPEVANFDLKNTLENDPIGKALILIYNTDKIFSTQCQSYMCDIISRHFLATLPDTLLEKDDIEYLSYKIKELFPNEISQTYYVPPIKKKNSILNKSELAKRKLWDKYKNKWAFIRDARKRAESSLAHSTDTPVNSSLSEGQITSSVKALESKLQLRNDFDHENIITNWNETYSLRLSDVADNIYKTFADITNEWPILKQSNNYELIQLDFQKIYNVSYDEFVSNWNKAFPLLLSLFNNKLSDAEKLNSELLSDDNLSKDVKSVIQFQLIASCLPPKSKKLSIGTPMTAKTIKRKKQLSWRPSAIEGREGVVLHVKVPGDLEHDVNEKRKKMSEMGLDTKPFVIVVGQKITDIDKVYVRADNVMYEFSSFLSALYTLYQIYLVFRLPYPPQSENICYFIQWQLFDIKIDSDQQVPFVYNIMNQMKLMPEK